MTSILPHHYIPDDNMVLSRQDRGPYDSQRCGAMVVKHMKTCILKNPDKKEACMREARQCGQEENLKKALEGKEALPRASGIPDIS